ncbi:glycosyltransferase [Gelidibacter gilvus]|uniref:Glycosyltransferase family 4 protein n=1 Tax=Gelidibacter gilvus TaxID=59602 RepID=A0A4Q0XCL8_9FLAO|nr:glycosyltransferase [Gelidibacter gilvus]RXJ44316.1 glycosyltransferase family 4 protein [Gelidibacter gilvus]
MKIGIIAHNDHPIFEPFQGGLEMFTSLLVNELVKRDYEVYTLCNRGSQLSGEMVFYTELDQNLNDDPVDSELNKFGEFYSSINTFLAINFDVIHNHSISHHAIVLGSVIDIPFVTSFHCPIFDNIYVAINAIKNRPNQIFTTVSNHLKVDFQKHLLNVRTVYNGIDLNAWEIYAPKEDYFSWCGRICKEKGLMEIMDLCHVNNLNLKIAGPISDRSYFEEFITPRLEKYDHCEYLGHLNQKQVNQLYAQSKAFLFSSIWQEPYGMVIAEALASGTPVIANDIGAASEIITDDCGILFDINKPETFVRAIAGLNTLDRVNCRERAENFCSHLRMVDAYEQIYIEIASEK